MKIFCVGFGGCKSRFLARLVNLLCLSFWLLNLPTGDSSKSHQNFVRNKSHGNNCPSSRKGVRGEEQIRGTESFIPCLKKICPPVTMEGSLNYKGRSNTTVVMYRCENQKGWAPKYWCSQMVVLEKTLESPLDWKEIQPVHSKGTQSWIFTGRTDAEAETTILWQFSSVQSLSRVQLFATPWIAARQASLSITNSQSSLRLTSVESVMPSNYFILCHPLLLPPIFPSIRVFLNELALCIRWPKYWSFSFNISPSNEHSGLISFRMDWLDLLAVQGTLKCCVFTLLIYFTQNPVNILKYFT